jgi:hypothetical protein
MTDAIAERLPVNLGVAASRWPGVSAGLSRERPARRTPDRTGGAQIG